jgi:hypothetical protein
MKVLPFAAAFLALFGSLKLRGEDPQQPGLPTPPAAAIETIVFLRHGEKPDKEIGQLDCQGLNRALALPRVLMSKFGRPDFLFAPATTRLPKFGGGGGPNYLRPLATIEPTAIQLGMPVDTDFAYSNIDGLESELIQQKYQNALIFVAWEHNELVNLVRQLVSKFHGDPNQVPNWYGSDFDSLYVVRITGPGPTRSVSFAQDHEGLSNLSNDCP